VAGTAINYFRTLTAPAGTLVSAVAPPGGPGAGPAPSAAAPETTGDWPSYNKTNTSQRFSGLARINRSNVQGLKVLCVYDTKEMTSFESGLIMVDGALIGTTEHDIFSLDPASCRENWRTHEDYPSGLLKVNRGAAYMDGMLFRGTLDGRVLAYDFKSGKRVWATTIAEVSKGESVSAAPIAWNGLVYIGNAGGDMKGGKGHMYALEARTGKIVWQFDLVPRAESDPVRGPLGKTPLDLKTWKNASGTPVTGGGTWTSFTFDPEAGEVYVPGGNPAPDYAVELRQGGNLYTDSVVVLDASTGDYKRHYQIVPKDWHDWDVSNPPVILRTWGGKKLLSVAPKNGYVYGFDLATNAELYRTPATRIENADTPFAVGRPVHFCPGSVGGDEWNGPGYDPQTNLILVGEVEWCASVTLNTDEAIGATKLGTPWSGMATRNPYHVFGRPDPWGTWAGWLYAIDADTGVWKWRVKTNYPIQSGITPTAGGVTFFGDMGGNLYAIDSATGQRLWGQKIGGAIGGGVITYTVGDSQKVAAAVGFTSILWPTEPTTGKVVILDLDARSPER
jgi:alcohol dehydrogenase (cytochrome c)